MAIEITPEQLAELREKAENSIANDFDGDIKGDGRWYRSRLGYNVYSVKTEDIMAKVQGDYDADFIASANPAVVLALVAEIERLRAMIESVICTDCGQQCKFCICELKGGAE